MSNDMSYEEFVAHQDAEQAMDWAHDADAAGARESERAGDLSDLLRRMARRVGQFRRNYVDASRQREEAIGVRDVFRSDAAALAVAAMNHRAEAAHLRRLLDERDAKERSAADVARRHNEALDLLARFDTPGDRGRVNALIGDLRQVLGGAR